MPLLTNRLKVIRPTSGKQFLVRRYYISRWCFWSVVLDEEHVPSWAQLQIGCFGDTEWRSKFCSIKEAWVK